MQNIRCLTLVSHPPADYLIKGQLPPQQPIRDLSSYLVLEKGAKRVKLSKGKKEKEMQEHTL